jgi:hypothetical protein
MKKPGRPWWLEMKQRTDYLRPLRKPVYDLANHHCAYHDTPAVIVCEMLHEEVNREICWALYYLDHYVTKKERAHFVGLRKKAQDYAKEWVSWRPTGKRRWCWKDVRRLGVLLAKLRVCFGGLE